MESQLQKAINVIVRVADPEKIILFGSRARGDYRDDSDYDLCVIKSNIEHRRRLAKKLYRYLYETGAAIDLIVETPEKFNELKNNPYMIYKAIKDNGRLIYEKEN
jgi:predicted nucleotidyltransferase